jgi:predicted dehydrogenase
MTGPVSTGVLVGYGSVGRRHARVLAGLAPSLTIVEAKELGRAQAQADHPSALVVESLDALDGHGVSWESALAVVATWGPSHAPLFHALADRGVRRIMCEKPLASSVALANGMVCRALRDGIALAVHHYIRYSGLAPALRRLADEHGLGEPAAVRVEGGASCLLTNGVHWLDFASDLFGATPVRVVSTARGEAINPRSPDLMLYEGTAAWTYADGREATISFSNRSSVALTARVYYRNAVAEVSSGLDVTLLRRDAAAVARFPAVTRTGAASERAYAGHLPGVPEYDDAMCHALTELAGGEPLTAPGVVGAAAVGACIGALAASREGRAVSLPIDPAGALGMEVWPIS